MFNAHNEIATRFAGSIIAFIAGNPILNTDSYKASHYDMLPEGTTKLQSYIESRGGKWDQTVFFGLQAYLKEYLMRPITRQNIEDAAWFFEQHGEPFNREGWEYILEKYNGYLPLHVRAPKEGSVIPVKNCLVTVENTDDNCAWLTSYIEPAILRGVWYGVLFEEPCCIFDVLTSDRAHQIFLEIRLQTEEHGLVPFTAAAFDVRLQLRRTFRQHVVVRSLVRVGVQNRIACNESDDTTGEASCDFVVCIKHLKKPFKKKNQASIA
jgi:hypothetical protein